MFQFLSKLNGRKAGGAGHTGRDARRQSFRPRLEGLEDRLVMSGTPGLDFPGIGLTAQGMLAIMGSNNALATTATVNILDKGTPTNPHLVVEATLRMDNALPTVKDFDLYQSVNGLMQQKVLDINFIGVTQFNTFTDNTFINCQAYGSGEVNSLTGGTGKNVLSGGGTLLNYLYSRGSADTLYGSSASTAYNYFYSSSTGVTNDYGGGPGGSHNTFEVYYKNPRLGTLLHGTQETFVHNFNPATDAAGQPYDVIHNHYV